MTRVIFVSIAIAVLGFVPLMGIPGAIVLMLAKPIVNIIYGPMAYESFNQSLGPSSWALCLILAILWPICIPIAYALCQKVFGPQPFFSIKHLVPFSLFVLVGATIISSITVSMNSNLKRLTDTEVLEQALRHGKVSLVKEHWDPNEKIEYSFGDPLFLALQQQQSGVANYLLDNGADPQQYHQSLGAYVGGETPLHTATTTGMLSIVQKLLQQGVNPNIRSTDGKVPLHNLGRMDNQHSQILDLYKTYNADFKAIDNAGDTPLITLSKVGGYRDQRPLLAQKLIDYGCPRDHKNKEGQTALSIVKEKQSHETELIAILAGETKQ